MLAGSTPLKDTHETASLILSSQSEVGETNDIATKGLTNPYLDDRSCGFSAGLTEMVVSETYENRALGSKGLWAMVAWDTL